MDDNVRPRAGTRCGWTGYERPRASTHAGGRFSLPKTISAVVLLVFYAFSIASFVQLLRTAPGVVTHTTGAYGWLYYLGMAPAWMGWAAGRCGRTRGTKSWASLVSPSGKSMNLKNPVFIALAIISTASVASAADPVWPKDSASDLSIFVTIQRFRIYADHCSGHVPRLKPKFDSLMENLNSHIQRVSKSLLSSSVFKGMKDKPVPAEISFAFKDSLDDAKHNFERQDVDSICPKALQNLSEMDDESLKSDLTQTLMAVQSMIRNLEKESAR